RGFVHVYSSNVLILRGLRQFFGGRGLGLLVGDQDVQLAVRDQLLRGGEVCCGGLCLAGYGLGEGLWGDVSEAGVLDDGLGDGLGQHDLLGRQLLHALGVGRGLLLDLGVLVQLGGEVLVELVELGCEVIGEGVDDVHVQPGVRVLAAAAVVGVLVIAVIVRVGRGQRESGNDRGIVRIIGEPVVVARTIGGDEVRALRLRDVGGGSLVAV